MAIAFTGGRILTMAPGAMPDVVVVEGGRVADVGASELLTKYPGAEVHDLGGRTLLPGFIDAHNHLALAALQPVWLDAADARTVEELLDMVRTQAAQEPDVPWIRVSNWTDALSGVVPTRADLDSLGLDRPIIVAHFSLHQAVVCSRGLDNLGIGRDTPDPVGGEIVRGPDGEPTGLLIERAWSEAEARSLEGYTDPDRWGDLVVARARTLLRDGITAIHDAACPPEAEALYRDLVRDGRLAVSVLAMPHPAAALMNDHRARWRDGPKSGEGEEGCRTGATKFFADGGTAIALDVTMNGHPLQLGITMDDLEECLVDATRQGFRVGVHAMGNRGVQLAIDSFAAARRAMPDEDHRFRLEHVGVASADQGKAMADLGAIGVVQPGFCDHVSDQSQGARFDDHHWLPFRTLVDAGVMLAGSSDDPCAPWAPIWCSARGATRTSIAGNVIEADEAVDFDVWMRAYTAGAAYAGGQEHERGSIAPGLRADFVVLEGDLDPHDPPTVAETWVAGERVYAHQPPSK